jgi:mycoredoxin
MLLWIKSSQDFRERLGGHCGILTSVTDSTAPEPAFTMFTTTTCGPCLRLKQRLTDLGIAFEEVGLEADDAASEWVMTVNDGLRMVPTLRFSDGSVMTNPSIDQVLAKLVASGQAGPSL